MFCDNYEEFTQLLTKKGYVVHSAANREEAAQIAMELAGTGSCGFGGSVTIDSLGIYEKLREQGNALYWHWKDKEHAGEMREKAIFTDVYFSSVNAISGTGALVNIDGTGNRAAAQFFGPKREVFVIGKNKYAPTLEDAIFRARNIASPVNAKRLGRKTPCAVTGKCENCNSPERICNVITIIERPTGGVKEMHLILTDEELGF